MGRRTIGKHWPKSKRGTYQAMCDHCGVMWYRSELRRDAGGSLTCPDEGPGLSSVALDELTAMNAQELSGPLATGDGGTFITTDTSDLSEPVQRTTLEDIEL